MVKTKPLFQEEQKFSQWWVWVILIGAAIFTLVSIYNVLKEGLGAFSPAAYVAIFSSCIVLFGVILLFVIMRLKTEITQQEVRMKFIPFVKRNVPWAEIKSAEVINYGFVGGWGIRLWTAYGTVYNIKGNKGLAVELINGKKFLIGTQKEDEMNRVIHAIEERPR